MDTTDGQVATAPMGASQFLTFRLAGEQYGVDILAVQEIRGSSTITPIPHTPPHVKGAMNLRGNIIPVIDLRVKFGVAAADADAVTVIIIVREAARTIGLVVDAVSDVLDVRRADVHPPPDLGAAVDLRFIAGIVHAGEQLVLLLDLARVLGDEELTAVEEIEVVPC